MAASLSRWIWIDETKADTPGCELVVQPPDFRRVAIGNRAVDADKDQHRHRERTYHSVLNLRQIVSHGRCRGNALRDFLH